jgi:hypothetical protein
MRLRQRDLKPYQLKKHGIFQEPDGTTYEGYEDVGTTIRANIQPAGGKVMAEMYGQRLAYMMTMYCQNDVDIAENDGICVYVDKDKDPDYKVVSVQNWNTHKVVSLEVIR